jgi:hypothetical protein
MCCHVVTHVMAVPSVAIQIQHFLTPCHWFDSESVKEVKGVREADMDALSKWLKCQSQCPCLGKGRNEEGKTMRLNRSLVTGVGASTVYEDLRGDPDE